MKVKKVLLCILNLALAFVTFGEAKTLKVGTKPESVCRGFGGKLYVTMINNEEPGDGGSAILDISSGGLATFTGGYWHPRWMNDIRWTIRGTQRWVHWDTGRANTGGALEICGPQPQFMAMEETFELPVDDTTGYGGKAMVALLTDWIRAIGEGGDCRNTPESTVTVLETIDSIYQSSESGHRVKI